MLGTTGRKSIRHRKEPGMGVRYFGARVNRIEDPNLVTGKGRYVDDLTVPGMRTPPSPGALAHARIRGINTEAARAIPGVIAVLTLADLGPAATNLPSTAPAPVIKQQLKAVPARQGRGSLCRRDRRHGGGGKPPSGRGRRGMVDVDYDPLPALSDWRRALERDAPKAHADLPTTSSPP